METNEREKLNTTLKQAVEEFVIEILENCELFVKTYGRGFAREKLSQNFKEISIDFKNDKGVASFTLDDSGRITLYILDEDGEEITLEDLLNNPELRSTLLHECVHAIFYKTPEECEALGITGGGSFHEIYSPYDNPKELGRGLDEGYTNWVCIQAGVNPVSYPRLTNLVRLLEVAIGPEEVMKFGRGDIKRNIAPLLQMSVDECSEFLAKADLIYAYEEQYTKYLIISQNLNELVLYDNIKSKNPNTRITNSLQKSINYLESCDLYTGIMDNPDYLEYAQKNGFDPTSIEVKQAYFSHKYQYFLDKTQTLELELQEQIFSKYNIVERFEELIKSGNVSFEEYKTYSNLFRMLNKQMGPEYKYLNKFAKLFSKAQPQMLEKVYINLIDAFKSETITSEEIKDYYTFFYTQNFEALGQFRKLLSEIILPENKDLFDEFLKKLYKTNNLQNIQDYRVFELTTPNNSKSYLFYNQRDNDKTYSDVSDSSVTVLSSKSAQELDKQLDTIMRKTKGIGDNFPELFLKFRDMVSQENMNTKIQIAYPIIITSVEGSEPTFYLYNSKEIVLAQTTEFFPLNSFRNSNHTIEVKNFLPFEMQSAEEMFRIFLGNQQNTPPVPPLSKRPENEAVEPQTAKEADDISNPPVENNIIFTKPNTESKQVSCPEGTVTPLQTQIDSKFNSTTAITTSSNGVTFSFNKILRKCLFALKKFILRNTPSMYEVTENLNHDDAAKILKERAKKFDSSIHCEIPNSPVQQTIQDNSISPKKERTIEE